MTLLRLLSHDVRIMSRRLPLFTNVLYIALATRSLTTHYQVYNIKYTWYERVPVGATCR